MRKIWLVMFLLSTTGYPYDPLIINGERWYKASFAMTLDKRDGKQYRGPCGGVLIAPKFVLTAAHCISIFRAGDAKGRIDAVFLGANEPWNGKRPNGGRPYEKIDVIAHYVHPKYKAHRKSYDLALLELSRESRFPPMKMRKYRGKKKDMLTVYGMGRDAKGERSKELKRVHVPHIPDCGKLSHRVDHTMFCAGDGNGDSCYGDSGGPITLGDTLVGIVSWGKQCNLPDYPGVYARLDLDWINSVVEGDYD